MPNKFDNIIAFIICKEHDRLMLMYFTVRNISRLNSSYIYFVVPLTFALDKPTMETGFNGIAFMFSPIIKCVSVFFLMLINVYSVDTLALFKERYSINLQYL